MKRHNTDLLALLGGLLFVIVSIGFVVNETTGRTFNPAWVSAAGLVTLGTVALAVTLLRRPRDAKDG